MPRGRRPARERALIDRWILSELALATRAARAHMDAYLVYEATGVLTDFVDALSNWYVRRSRDRFWAPGLERDKLDAHWTLYECLTELARLLAPFLPFATEELWRNLVARPFGDAQPESVHLADYPEPDLAAIDEPLSREMRAVREIVSLGPPGAHGEQAARAPAARGGRGRARRSRARAARARARGASCATS